MEALTVETRGGLSDLFNEPPAACEAELKALREAELKAWREAFLKALREVLLKALRELIEGRIRYLEPVEERRPEEALVRRSLSPFSDSRSPDLNMLSRRMYGKVSTDAEQVPEKTLGRLSCCSMRLCSPVRDMLIFTNTDVAPVTDSWSCSLGSERTLRCPRMYGKGLKDYVKRVPDSRFGDSERTLSPYVTGSSVLGLKYRDGILIAADMGGACGFTLAYKNIERIKSIGKHSLLGASGEISDFQEILRYLDLLISHDNAWDDGNSLGPKEVHSYLTQVMYDKWKKFNPLCSSLVLGGVKNGERYLAMVDMMGEKYECNYVATETGNQLALPILCKEWNENLSFEDGVKLLERCMRGILYYDCLAVNRHQIAKITEEGATIFPPYSLKTNWGFEAYKNPTVGAVGSW